MTMETFGITVVCVGCLIFAGLAFATLFARHDACQPPTESGSTATTTTIKYDAPTTATGETDDAD